MKELVMVYTLIRPTKLHVVDTPALLLFIHIVFTLIRV